MPLAIGNLDTAFLNLIWRNNYAYVFFIIERGKYYTNFEIHTLSDIHKLIISAHLKTSELVKTMCLQQAKNLVANLSTSCNNVIISSFNQTR